MIDSGKCTDTPKWEDPKGNGCIVYKNWPSCHDGKPIEGNEKYMGKKYDFPEKNCCICGKPNTMIPKPPPKDPSPIVNDEDF